MDQVAMPTASDPLFTTPAAIELAREAVRRFPGCFWFWKETPPIVSAADVEEVVDTLRLNGGRDAWSMAAEIVKCR